MKYMKINWGGDLILVDREVINNKLIDLEEYINDLSEYENLELNKYNNDKLLRRYLERTLHLAIESILDIGNHIISDERFRNPNTNSEIIEILAENEIIKENEEKYIKMAKFRNIIVHDYAEVDGEIVVNIINNELDDLKKIFNWYKEYIA